MNKLKNHLTQHVTVKGLIYRKGKVLMLKDSKNIWELPGGKVSFGEHLEDTLKRELGEELGVKNVTIGGIIHAWDFSTTVQNTNHQFIVIVFECHADLSYVVVSSEHTAWEWVDLKEADDYPMKQGYLDSINAFSKNRLSDA